MYHNLITGEAITKDATVKEAVRRTAKENRKLGIQEPSIVQKVNNSHDSANRLAGYLGHIDNVNLEAEEQLFVRSSFPNTDIQNSKHELETVTRFQCKNHASCGGWFAPNEYSCRICGSSMKGSLDDRKNAMRGYEHKVFMVTKRVYSRVKSMFSKAHYMNGVDTSTVWAISPQVRRKGYYNSNEKSWQTSGQTAIDLFLQFREEALAIMVEQSYPLALREEMSKKLSEEANAIEEKVGGVWRNSPKHGKKNGEFKTLWREQIYFKKNPTSSYWASDDSIYAPLYKNAKVAVYSCPPAEYLMN